MSNICCQKIVQPGMLNQNTSLDCTNVPFAYKKQIQFSLFLHKVGPEDSSLDLWRHNKR